MSIKDLPLAARPREKLLAHGPAALADAELLALLLRTGVRGQGVLQLAQALLDQCGGFAGLLAPRPAAGANLPAAAQALKGIGPAKQAELAAVGEMARRALGQQLAAAPVFDHPQRLKDFAALHLAEATSEHFGCLFLDIQNRLLGSETLFHGTLHQTAVHARELVRRALDFNAAAVVLMHNHPSGVAEPSRADEALTHTLKSALGLVGVRVLDHLVVGRGTVVSFAERGML